MDSIGTLTKSGLLYEGNYVEWFERISASMKQQQFNWFYGDPIKDVQGKASVTWCAFYRLHTSAYVWKQMHEKLMITPEALLYGLQQRAVPFKLMELPAELRNIIFEYAVERTQHRVGTHVLQKQVCRLPDITRTNRQLRSETLGLLQTQ